MTDEHGKFAVPALDPELLFQLLVVAEGHVPAYSDRYEDPRLGAVTMELEPSDLEERPPELVLRGTVVDAHGAPVPRAVLVPEGVQVGRGRQFGGLDGIDPIAVTDARGEFRIGVAAAGQMLLMHVEARGFAPRKSGWLPAGSAPHELALARGTTVTGVLEQDGQPVRGVVLGLYQQDGNVETNLGERTVASDERGRFTFVNVPANEALFLYGKMESTKAHGALPIRPLRTGPDEATTDAGKPAFERGFRLSGRVVLADGQALPTDTRVLLDRDEAWDTQVVRAGADGSFSFDGVPRERIGLAVRVRGYHAARENESLDVLNGNLLGRMEGDVQDLVFLLEPGDFAPDRSQEAGRLSFERQERPLAGAPAKAER